MDLKVLTTREQIYNGVRLWNRNYPDYIIRDRLIEQNIFAPYDRVKGLAYGVFKDKMMTGFALVKYLTEPIKEYSGIDTGWISLLTGSRKEVFDLLLDEIEAKMLGLNKNRIRFGGDPQAFLPGLPADIDNRLEVQLQKKKYNVESYCADLLRDIKDFTPPECIKKLSARPGLESRRVRLQDETDLIRFLSENFPGRWLFEAENIIRIPGGAIDYWLLYKNKKPVAFARSNSVDSVYQGTNVNWGNRFGGNYCGMGPIGVAEPERGNGFGLLLMSEIIASFQRRGYSKMIIDWTTLLDYYSKLGFSPFIKYDILFKNLINES